jgi:cytidine deaminase
LAGGEQTAAESLRTGAGDLFPIAFALPLARFGTRKEEGKAMEAVEKLFAAAAAVRQHSYAPYSGFAVGAALRTPSGAVYSGANVENAAYPLGFCAEAAVIAAMVAAGEREIAEILVLADGAEPVMPCGACRQRLSEFATAETKVHSASPR